MFNPSTISVPLLLAVVLTGALFSLSVSERALARSMLDFAEDYAFDNPTFQDLLSCAQPRFGTDPRLVLESVQAAVSVFQIQLREGSSTKRKQMRTIRMSQLVLVSRPTLENLV